jgi:hypothetical protein
VPRGLLKSDDVCGAYGTIEEVAEKLVLDPVLKGRGFQPRSKSQNQQRL